MTGRRIGPRAATWTALALLTACAGTAPAPALPDAPQPSAPAAITPDTPSDAGTAPTAAFAPAPAPAPAPPSADEPSVDPVRAEHDLPGLFAQCAASRAVIQRWRIADAGAQGVGNYILGEQAHAEIDRAMPAWSATRGRILDAIHVLTNDRGPRHANLVRRVATECDCKPTPSGRCG